MSDLANAMDQVRNARWEGWKRMAAKLPDHHVLSVELFRTEQNDTLAVFTVVKGGRPVQQILKADVRGGKARAVVSAMHDGSPSRVGAPHDVEVSTADDGDADASSISLGEPPPKQPPDPGIVSLGSSMLQAAFELGELLASGSGA